KPAPATVAIDAEPVTKPAPATVAIDAEPVTKPAPATVAIDAEPVTKPAPATVAIDAEPVTKPAPATVAIDAEPVTKPAPATVAIDAEPEAKPAPATVVNEAESAENSIEPYREQEKALTADEDVKAWLSARRVSTADLIASDNDRESRHAASMAAEQSPAQPEAPKKNRQAEKQDDYFADETHRPVVPERIAKAYTQIDDRYYFQGRPDSLAFVDKGEKLQTKISNAQVAGSLVEIAEARGWQEIQLKGTQDFKREAWLQATAKGMTAHGYSPKEADLIRLKELSDKTKINEVSNATEAQAAKAPVIDSAASKGHASPNAMRPADIATESSAGAKNGPETSQSAPAKANVDVKPAINPLEGTLKEHGKAPFEFKDGNKDNYFVKLENADGKEKVHWGVDLERAIEKAEVQPGDKVELARTGRKEVIITEEIKDDKGKVIAVEEKATHRNTWEVKADAVRDKERPAAEVVKEHPDLVNEIATVKLAEKFSKGMDDKTRAAFMDGVREKLANDVQQGKQAPEIKIKEERSSSKTVNKDPEIER
ncbi:hypothetical protein LXA19_17360, partial [Erwinia amylovora]|uniref:LPD7 domain-containing protein n=1 Tax=Erwinia amylovora TaxID=552 RepID=UPI00296229ED